MANKLIDAVRKLFTKSAPFFTEFRMKGAIRSGKAVVGRHSYGKVYLYGEISKIYIGNFCSIGPDCWAFIGSNHRHDFISTYPFSYTKKHGRDWGSDTDFSSCNGDVVIGNDVWIGKGVTILSGVTIGDGAVVGAKALVTKNVEPYSMVGGNPARVIRYRFSPEEIERLLALAWWDWPIEHVTASLDAIRGGDVAALERAAPAGKGGDHDR